MPEKLTATNAPIKNIFQRINNVRKQVGYIKKDADIGSGNRKYKAVTHDAVTAALRGALIEEGIIILPNLNRSKMERTGLFTGSGAEIVRYTGYYSITFINEDDPSDCVILEAEGQSLDPGDKAPGIALSYAVKMVMLKAFSLETGENDEARIDAAPENLTEAQLNELRALCKENDLEPEPTLKLMAKLVFVKDDIQLVPTTRFDEAKERIIARGEKKRGAKNAGVGSSTVGENNGEPGGGPVGSGDNEALP